MGQSPYRMGLMDKHYRNIPKGGLVGAFESSKKASRVSRSRKQTFFGGTHLYESENERYVHIAWPSLYMISTYLLRGNMKYVDSPRQRRQALLGLLLIIKISTMYLYIVLIDTHTRTHAYTVCTMYYTHVYMYEVAQEHNSVAYGVA